MFYLASVSGSGLPCSSSKKLPFILIRWNRKNTAFKKQLNRGFSSPHCKLLSSCTRTEKGICIFLIYRNIIINRILWFNVCINPEHNPINPIICLNNLLFSILSLLILLIKKVSSHLQKCVKNLYEI